MSERPMNETGAHDPPGTLLRSRDAYFHTPAYRDPTWTETNWFGFFVPEVNMRGSVYMLFRPNVGVVRSLVLVYSRECESVLDLDYIDDRVHMPIPPGNLDEYRLDNGVWVKMKRALNEYSIRFDGRFDTHFDLHLTAMMPPVAIQEIRVSGSGPGYAVFQRTDDAMQTGHLDQTVRVTGEISVRGKRYSLDHPSNRDHSWSPRREWGHNRCGNFDEGHFGDGVSFHVQTLNDPLDVGEVTHGYVLVQGVPRRIVRGVGHYKYDGWRIKNLVYELEDETGRSYRFAGTPLSWCTDNLSGNFASLGFVRWDWEGEVGFGDFKWHWDVFRMQEHARASGEPGV